MAKDEDRLYVSLLSSAAQVPRKANPSDAGWDLCSSESATVPAWGEKLIKTGLKLAVPVGTYGRVAPRSGLALKGIDVGAGVIDRGYRGEVGIVLFNFSDNDFAVKPGDRVAQLILEKNVDNAQLEVVPEKLLPASSDRGTGGFASSGLASFTTPATTTTLHATPASAPSPPAPASGSASSSAATVATLKPGAAARSDAAAPAAGGLGGPAVTAPGQAVAASSAERARPWPVNATPDQRQHRDWCVWRHEHGAALSHAPQTPGTPTDQLQAHGLLPESAAPQPLRIWLPDPLPPLLAAGTDFLQVPASVMAPAEDLRGQRVRLWISPPGITTVLGTTNPNPGSSPAASRSSWHPLIPVSSAQLPTLPPLPLLSQLPQAGARIWLSDPPPSILATADRMSGTDALEVPELSNKRGGGPTGEERNAKRTRSATDATDACAAAAAATPNTATASGALLAPNAARPTGSDPGSGSGSRSGPW
jgi:dUTP pyrophosphatase